MSIYRAYDIRGIYGEDLNEYIMERIGNIHRLYTKDSLIVGMDCRISSPSLKNAFIKGANDAGINITDIGMVPRGVAMFWGWRSGIPSAYISASHLPAEWNGLKFTLPSGRNLPAWESLKIKEKIDLEDFVRGVPGKVLKQDVLERYIEFVMGKIPEPEKPLKILLDCGNGTAGVVAPELFRRKGYRVKVLFEKPDGRFPNRESELTESALEKAMEKAKKHDITIAYDGDADRIMLIDNEGRMVPSEVSAYLIMKELLKTQKGPIIANVECSKIIDEIAKEFSRELHRTPVGYTHVIEGVHKNKACFGIEKSMHFCIPSILPFDDGIPVTLYVAYVLSKMDKSLAEFSDSVPKFVSSTLNFECSDEKKFRVIENIKNKFSKEYKDINTLDGVRVNLNNGWVLIRASNTSPLIRMTAEADISDDLDKIKGKFSKIVEEGING